MGNQTSSFATSFTVNGIVNNRAAICSASENGSTTCLLSDSLTSAPTLFDCTTNDNTNFACVSRNSAYSNANCQGQNINGILQVVCNSSNNNNNLINLTITNNNGIAKLSWTGLAAGTTYYVIRSSNVPDGSRSNQPQILAQTQNTNYVDNNANGNYEYIIATRNGNQTAAVSNAVFVSNGINNKSNSTNPSPLSPSNPTVNSVITPTPLTPSYTNGIIVIIATILLIIIIICVLYALYRSENESTIKVVEV